MARQREVSNRGDYQKVIEERAIGWRWIVRTPGIPIRSKAMDGWITRGKGRTLSRGAAVRKADRRLARLDELRIRSYRDHQEAAKNRSEMEGDS